MEPLKWEEALTLIQDQIARRLRHLSGSEAEALLNGIEESCRVERERLIKISVTI